MHAKALFAFIKERESIRVKREAGKLKPWTKDPILQKFKFCNMHREDDRVTRWIATNWREPNRDDPNIWFAMLLARLVNRPDALADIGYPVPWKPGKFLKAMGARREAGAKMYTGAYIIHSEHGNWKTTYEYQEEKVFTPAWNCRKTFPKNPGSLREVHDWLRAAPFESAGEFIAAQVIADIKYCPAFSRGRVSDWGTFAAPGPGSKRGLARVYGHPVDYKWKEPDWQAALAALRAPIDNMLANAGMHPMHAQDLQNCLCEFDKYERVRLGEGRPRALYAGV